MVCRGAGDSLNCGVLDRKFQAQVCRMRHELGTCWLYVGVAVSETEQLVEGAFFKGLSQGTYEAVSSVHGIQGKADRGGKEMSSEPKGERKLLVSAVCH